MPKNLLEDENLLDAGLRNANPFPVDGVPELDGRALSDLASILGQASSTPDSEAAIPVPAPQAEASNVVQLNGISRKSKITRRWVLGAVAAVAAGVLVAVPMGASLNGSGKAIASPLPLTGIKPTTMSTVDAVTQLLEAAGNHPDPADFNPGHLKVGHWEAGSMFVPLEDQFAKPVTLEDGSQGITLIEGDFDERISIPTVTETKRKKDLSGSITQTVGDPFSTTGEAVEFVPFDGNQTPGSVDTIDFKAGEMQVWFKNAPAKDPKQLFEQIQKFQKSNNAAVGDGSEGFIQSVGFMLTDWKLNQTQSKALLEMLPSVENLGYLGTATDRWDRKTMVFGVKTPTQDGTYQTMLMFNPDTGRPVDYVEEFHLDKNAKGQSHYEYDFVTRYKAYSE